MKYEARFTLEIVTPLMISNGEVIDGGNYSETRNKNGKTITLTYQRKIKTAELRVPSIKGVIRWWYRAIAGCCDMKELKESEDRIFGSTEGTSKIKMRIENAKLDLQEWSDKCWKDYRCSNVAGKNYPINGYQYLSYTNYVKDTNNNRIDIRKFIKPDSKFDLIISSMNKDTFESALISFWFALNFGGFGNRARRGFGKLQMIKKEISPEPTNGDILKYFDFCYKDITGFAKMIQDGITGLKEYRKRNGIKDANNTQYTNILNAKLYLITDKANFDCKVNLDKIPYDTWELALNEAGKRFQYFRQEYPSEKNEILKKDKIDICNLKKPVFGLPIGYRFNNHYKATVKHKEDSKSGIGDRFASPVWISIHKIGGHYYPAFLFMFSNPAPNMVITVNNKDAQFKQNNNILNEFITKQLNGITPIEFKP